MWRRHVTISIWSGEVIICGGPPFAVSSLSNWYGNVTSSHLGMLPSAWLIASHSAELDFHTKLSKIVSSIWNDEWNHIACTHLSNINTLFGQFFFCCRWIGLHFKARWSEKKMNLAPKHTDCSFFCKNNFLFPIPNVIRDTI